MSCQNETGCETTFFFNPTAEANFYQLFYATASPKIFPYSIKKEQRIISNVETSIFFGGGVFILCQSCICYQQHISKNIGTMAMKDWKRGEMLKGNTWWNMSQLMRLVT